MPTYSYACKQCGHRFETVQSFTDAALTECPECGGEVRKQYGSIGVTFNGSGFYRTDSRNSSSSSSSSSGASAGGASSSSTSSKAQSKPSAPSSAS